MFDQHLKGKELLIILPALQLQVTTPATALLREHLQGRNTCSGGAVGTPARAE